MSKVQGSVSTISSISSQKTRNTTNRMATIDRVSANTNAEQRKQQVQPLLKKVLPSVIQQLSNTEKADDGHTSSTQSNYMLKMLFSQLNELGEKIRVLDENPADLAVLRKALAKNKAYLERALISALQSNTQQMVEAGSGHSFKGSMGRNVVLGGDGNDWLFGGMGDDLLVGGHGDDKLQGGEGDDILNGGEGMDTLYGGEGMDTLNGGEGKDTIYIAGGNDEVNAGTSNDNILSGLANDRAESNVIDGGAGNDIVRYANNRSDYKIKVHNAENSYSVTNLKTGATDTLKNVERLHFRNGTVKASSLKAEQKKE